ncbi:MAG: TlpA family protein disulfide reductase [Flavobacteriales bacterium]|nr:TlpA family protein disulfide reductase [Flavobacteriia bacterium]NCP06569.1 TlpA family protein disulfide reductase [Flavobacteriales bacterium]PIV92807.1 MAG: TlpA family protein disulfide reductase [Flavobacteriaceae bacterium CG17_big_fil_post_rev_8_21_14_2_50_33_15]PIY13202.1 MAG: TlpA family protein disulfide reductase [Flavobacteriaceae bacterium CG_4_10_14_3_um_filter_33_47]PJB18247.1 MAG: TlpA family protein disulfide reductase [Flavobacteriaceae bacterium CG_4_9_14_3_um_filter_33_1
MKKLLIFFYLAVILSCENEKIQLTNGIYRATLKVNDTLNLPFNFEVTSPKTLKIFNADEVILVDEVVYENDSVYIKMPVFEGFLAAKISNDNNLIGLFINKTLNRKVPFKATFENNMRFEINTEPSKLNISGNWETVFSPNNEEDRYLAKGIFKQMGKKVSGTFRTTTGDYRFLDGIVEGNELKLSTFDGSHAFLFTAKITDSVMQGMFYSGNHWSEPFVAKRNEFFELPDENQLTFLKEGYDRIDFSFPDASGELISISDNRFKNKVVVVQIMGTWCPNCLDESKFYSEFYKKNKSKDIEFIALAFEYSKTSEMAFKNMLRLKETVGIEYPILLAQYGSSNKKQAQEKLPMLNHVLSYPTTIYIDKKGKVRKIHTGFNGPATGEKYTEFKKEFNQFIHGLLNE